jgi:predicted ABC-type ATPase
MRYTIIGGINGVGKSTVYSLLTDAEKRGLGRRINVDEIVAGIGHWSDAKAQFAAGRKAVAALRVC